MANEYDLAEAFRRIENELMASMIRNMDRHRAEETEEGYNWSMWQAEQLKALEKYKRVNRKKYGKQFQSINDQIEELIRISREKGNMHQEIVILKNIRRGYRFPGVPEKIYDLLDDMDGRSFKEKAALFLDFIKGKNESRLNGEFFKLNDRKLEALIKATRKDMEKAETAVLRKADDDYRKAIFNAQVYANTGAGTYEKAVDMATKDMLSRGLNCVMYANGARHTLSDYADMAIRTASKRAYLQGEGEKRQEWGITTVIMAKRGNPCPKCLPFVGKVLVDDVWSGGRSDGVDPETGKKYPTMSYAISKGLHHPRCKDSHTTYFPGFSTADDTWTKEELEAIGQQSKDEAKEQYAARQEEKYGRLAEYSLDKENQGQYRHKVEMWKNVQFKTGGLSHEKYEESKRPLADFHPLPQEKVVDVLRKESEEWIQTLSGKEQHAIRKYTYNSGDKKPNRFFERLNAMLRGDIPQDVKLKEYGNTISNALKKNKLQYDVIAYRGSEVDPSEGIDINGLFRAKQFYSTSVLEGRSFGYKYKIEIYVKRGSDAAYIENLSVYKKQRELLLDRDCIFRVLSRQGNTIRLEVV